MAGDTYPVVLIVKPDASRTVCEHMGIPFRGAALNQHFEIKINDLVVRVRPGTTVAAAMIEAGANTRHSVCGQPRQPLCGMGICYECRAQVDGEAHQRTCQILCRPGMQVVTQ